MKAFTGKRFAAFLLAVFTLSVLLVGCLPAAFAAAEEPTDTAVAVVDSADPGTFANSHYPKLPENASFGDRVVYGLKVVGIGMGIVFLVLLILMAVLYVFKLVAKSKSKSKEKKAQPENGNVPLPQNAAPDGSGNEEELVVAIATAAIAASRGESDCAFRVISVTKLS